MAFIRTHINCEHCGSSDGASLNDDHSTYCFVCSTHTPSSENITIIKETKVIEPIADMSFVKAFNNGNSVSVSERRITKSTMEKYGVVRESGNF